MSFKLFTLQILGKIKPTEKIEATRAALWDDYQEFLKVEKSDELKEYLELEKWVNSEDFKKRKKEIESLRFKGSREFNQLNEFTRLAKSKEIKKYLQLKDSAELTRFEDIKKSEKLEQFYKLQDFVEEGEYQKEKKQIKGQVYKGSVEERHLLEFVKLKKSKPLKAYFELHGSKELAEHKEFSESTKLRDYLRLRNSPEKDKEKKKKLRELKRDSRIKKYFRFERSQKLKLYREASGSHDLKRYHELEIIINSDDFIQRKAYLQDKTKFEKSDAYAKFNQYKQLKNDKDIKFFLAFEKSKIYKNYLDVKDSFDLKRYFELKEITESEEFLKRKAYLEDKKKWEKSEEYSKQQHFLSMKKFPHLVRYFKYLGKNDFDFFKNWEVVFEELFDTGKLDESKWITNSFWGNKLVKGNFSQIGDLQCFNSGKNIVLDNKKLKIQIKKEHAKGKVWNPASGFMPADFEYTSDMLCSGESFWLEEGIVEAKILFNPVKQVVSSFYLLGEKVSPQVNLLEMGAKNRFGTFLLKDGNTEFNGISIGNLKKGRPYLFRLCISKDKLVWKINDQEVFETDASQFKFPMHLNLSSIVVRDIPGSILPVNFEVSWIRCYKEKGKS
ncbi:MAG: hypothetical protein GXO81_06305 [Chlorobi bacterium]|nr:hypothetical protein [Chlorobiota bacterium]